MKPVLRIGSRRSDLALAQANWVRRNIVERFPELEVSISTIRVAADRAPNTPIREGSATGVFVKEIEQALAAGEIDLAVHSMKDLPSELAASLEICSVPPREDPRDALVSQETFPSLESMPPGSIIGTGSPRRQSQILAARADLSVADIRGNVDTRLRKLAEGKYHAIVLAVAGLKRLGLQHRVGAYLSPDDMLPAAGQGALALETRSGDTKTAQWVRFLNDRDSAVAVGAERAFLSAVGAGCNSPIAAFAKVIGGEVRIDVLVASKDGSHIVREYMVGRQELVNEMAVALAEKVGPINEETFPEAPNSSA